ncbi:MAG: bifunctional DNA-formamidopyrimidine glycosylase/DNA-(apurinic or apyrimidinic site) lyase [Gammaproteobacteria bacterium]
MPELPEVETCRRGLLPHVINHTITQVIIREARLRWPIPIDLPNKLINQKFRTLTRRGKYLLFGTSSGGTLLLHLGMSGHVRIIPASTVHAKHDHVDIIFDNNKCLRFNDTRRFGAMLWIPQHVEQHPLLAKLGPEPLTDDFNDVYLYTALKRRKQAIKLSLMDNHVVVGVGNIYANEALFRAGIHPEKPSHKVTRAKLTRLVSIIKTVLTEAITAGGTTLRDFLSTDGTPGYFQQTLYVYGRGGKPCRICDQKLVEIKMGQRSTVFCTVCQRR